MTSGEKPINLCTKYRYGMPQTTRKFDYTLISGPQRVRDLLDLAEAETRLTHRFAQINLWRPIAGPVEQIADHAQPPCAACG
jgi:hypothetical protein